MNPNRQPAGVPVGGQFAATARPEAAAVDLTPNDTRVSQGCSCRSFWEGPTADCPVHGITGLHATAARRTRLQEELDELIEQVDHEHELAREAHQDAIDVAWTAASYGTAAEKRTYNAQHDEAKAELEVADRRRKAVRIAADPAAHRPDPAAFTTPESLTGLRRAVKDAKAGKVHGIVLTSAATAKLDGRLDIAGPTDGTPLFVDVASGFAPLRVTGGVVVVNAHSAMGNGIDVAKDATVVVLAGPGRKVSTSVDGGVACVVGADGTRGLQFNRDGVLDVVAKTDAMTVSKATR